MTRRPGEARVVRMAVGAALATLLLAGCGDRVASQAKAPIRQRPVPTESAHPATPLPPAAPAAPPVATTPAAPPAARTPSTVAAPTVGALPADVAQLDASLAEVDGAMTSATDMQAKESQ